MSDPVETRTNPDAAHRILVLAHRGLGGPQLVDLLAEQEPDRGCEIFVVVPALSGSLKQLANDDGDEIAAAQADLDRLLAEVAGRVRTVTGLVGDSDPRLALEDSLRQFAADEIVVVNPAEQGMNHLEETSTDRAVEDVSLPVRVLNVTP